MAQVTDIKDGTVSDSVYLVEYNEDQWMKYSEEDKQYCMDTWVKKAKPTGVSRVVVKIHPDILFPRYGRDRPYIDRQYRFPQEEKGWQAHRVIHVQTNTDQVSLTEADLKRIEQVEIANELQKGDKLILRNCNDVVLWEQSL